MRASWVGTLLSGTILVVSVSLASGGYFRASWLWLTLGLCSLAGIVLLLRERIVLGRLDPLEAAALACFSAWTALSASWSSVPTQSLHDAERGLVYLAALLAFALLVERETVYGLLAGVCLGAVLVSAFSLAQRLFATG